jgi:probable DNA metabolism protein
MRVPEDFHYYLSMHLDCNERLLARARLFAPRDLEISTDPDVIRLRKMVSAVMGEVYRMKAFVRLKPLGSNVLYGYLKPRHRIGEHVCDHFAQRTPGIIAVLGNGSESWVSLFREGRIMRDHGRGMNETLERLSSALDCPADGLDVGNPDAGDLKVDDLWQVYYDSQYCPERKNLAIFRQRMPRRDQDAAGLRLVQNKREVTLDDFLGDGRCTEHPLKDL